MGTLCDCTVFTGYILCQRLYNYAESLGISNDFLFGKIMQDADAKSIRLDVYVKDNKSIVYNIFILLKIIVKKINELS